MIKKSRMNNKILCFSDSLGLGGAQRQLVGLASLLKEKGYDVTVLLYHNIPFYKHLLDENDVKSVCISSSALTRVWYLYRYLKKSTYDVIIAYQSSPSILACFLRPFIPLKKLIVSERGTSEIITVKTRILFKLWRFADYIVPNSYSQTNFIKKNVPKYSNKVTTITNFIDTNHFIPSHAIKIENCPLRIVSLGRITHQKNIIKYIEAIYLVKCFGHDIEVMWYGDTDNSEYNNLCKDLIHKYNLEKVFAFYPANKNVMPLYQDADVFCLPSLYEGFPNVVCEAMSCGLPILCSNICDNPLIVEDGENGILFSPDRAENIADAIIKYMNLSDEKKVQMGVRSRELALEKFSSEVFIQKYIDLIEN